MEKQVMQFEPNVQTNSFPTEIITLPSKGLLYPKNNPLSKGTVEMRYMTAKHEDILTNESYIKSGVVIEKLLEALVVSPIKLDDLLIGDKNAIIVAARILGYGKDYTFKYNSFIENKTVDVTVDLANVKDKELDEVLVKSGENKFAFTLPICKKVVEFKLLTQGDEKTIETEIKHLKKLYKDSSPEASIRLKHSILTIDNNSDPKFIQDFIENTMRASESRELRKYIAKISPDVDLTFTYEGDGYTEEGVSIPVGVSFFWPDI